MAMNPTPSATSAEAFLSALRSVLGTAKSPISLHEPSLRGSEWEYVKDCLDSGWVSSVGKYVDEFEHRLANYTGAKYAIAVVNGTAALHVALLAAGVEPGDEVLIPALTFIATPNAVSYCGAIPHFVDSADSNFGIDPEALAEYLKHIAEPATNGYRNRISGRRLAAIVPMHVFGHPAKMEALCAIAAKYKLVVIEDAAESLGSRIGDKHTGTFGMAGALSFNGNKILTTGGGGAVLTDNSELARLIKHVTTTAKTPHKWEFFHDLVAYNYRMPNINAALGCAQLESLPLFLGQKRKLARIYEKAFQGCNEFTFVSEPQGCVSNYWLNTIRLKQPDRLLRDLLLGAANDAGYMCRPAWTLMHRLPMYKGCPSAPLHVAEKLEAELINVPSSPGLAGGSA